MSRLLAGRRPVLEALRAGTPLERIRIRKGVHGPAIEEIRTLAARRKVPLEELGAEEFSSLGGTDVTQGVVAWAGAPATPSLGDLLARTGDRTKPGFLLVLDEIEDPHNLGALIRTAECAGVDGVVIPRHRSAPLSAAAVRSSAGATEHMPLVTVTNLARALEEMKQAGYWVVGLDAEAERLYSSVEGERSLAVVVGNEGRGLRRLVREKCDYLVRIPLRGRISSLNASVAGALMMYEVVRARTH